jgi:hypothetical protein
MTQAPPLQQLECDVVRLTCGCCGDMYIWQMLLDSRSCYSPLLALGRRQATDEGCAHFNVYNCQPHGQTHAHSQMY